MAGARPAKAGRSADRRLRELDRFLITALAHAPREEVAQSFFGLGAADAEPANDEGGPPPAPATGKLRGRALHRYATTLTYVPRFVEGTSGAPRDRYKRNTMHKGMPVVAPPRRSFSGTPSIAGMLKAKREANQKDIKLFIPGTNVRMFGADNLFS
eukprot:6197243-Prymnesium_polylepis.1